MGRKTKIIARIEHKIWHIGGFFSILDYQSVEGFFIQCFLIIWYVNNHSASISKKSRYHENNTLPYKSATVLVRNCGLNSFLRTKCRKHESGATMEIDYSIHYSHWHADNAESRQRDMEYLAFFLDIHQLLPHEKTAKILDLGCAMGRLLLTFKKLGYMNVYGVEKDATLSAIAEKDGLSIFRGDILDYLFATTEQFDAIFLIDVLEHIAKDQQIALLQTIYQKLTPTGYVIVQVPNAASPGANVLVYDDFTHHNMFGEKALYFCLRNAGFPQINIREQGPPYSKLSAIIRSLYDGIYKSELNQEALLSFNLVAVAYKNEDQKNTILPRKFPSDFVVPSGEDLLMGIASVCPQPKVQRSVGKKQPTFERKSVEELFPWAKNPHEYQLDYAQYFFVDILPWLEKLPDDFDTILDLGCAQGFTSAFFHTRGHTVTACDPWDRFQFKDIIPYHHATSEIFQDAEFDAIILPNVLQTMPNPQIFMDEVRRLLKEDGYLFITLPLSLRVDNSHWWQGWSLPQLGVFLANLGFDCRRSIFETRGDLACAFGKKMDKPLSMNFNVAEALSYLPVTFGALAIDVGWGYSLHTNATYIDSSRIDRTDYPYTRMEEYNITIKNLTEELQVKERYLNDILRKIKKLEKKLAKCQEKLSKTRNELKKLQSSFLTKLANIFK